MTKADITSMGDYGLGWGQLGHELDMHPGMLGYGHNGGRFMHKEGMTTGPNHTSGVNEHKIREATTINMESGWSQGHGIGIQSGVHAPGSVLMSGGTWRNHD